MGNETPHERGLQQIGVISPFHSELKVRHTRMQFEELSAKEKCQLTDAIVELKQFGLKLNWLFRQLVKSTSPLLSNRRATRQARYYLKRTNDEYNTLNGGG